MYERVELRSENVAWGGNSGVVAVQPFPIEEPEQPVLDNRSTGMRSVLAPFVIDSGWLGFQARRASIAIKCVQRRILILEERSAMNVIRPILRNYFDRCSGVAP